MGALSQRLRRAEKTLRIGDEFSEFEKMTDEELEDALRILLGNLEAKWQESGRTREEFRADMDAMNAAEGLPPHDWSLLE